MAMQKRLSDWWRGHDKGLSSEAIFLFMTLGMTGLSTPSDPSDLGRCVRLLEAFPEWKARMPEMETASQGWSILIPHWDDIVTTFIGEAGGTVPAPYTRFDAPKTYEQMMGLFYDKHPSGVFIRRAMERSAA